MGQNPLPVRLAAPQVQIPAPLVVVPAAATTSVPIMSLVVWLLLLAGLAIVGSRMEEMFRDFGVALDAGTRALLSTSAWLRGQRVGQLVPGVAIASPLIVGLHVGLIIAGFRPRHVTWARAVALVLLVGGILIIGYSVLAFGLASATVARSVQQAGR